MLKFIFDLDGTITSAETLPIISKEFNVHKELMSLTKDTVDGKIPWKHSFIRRVGLLKHIPVSDIDVLLEKTPVYDEIVRFIQQHSDQCVIATGNLDCWIDKLCKKIGCEYYSSRAQVINNEIHHIDYVMEKSEVVTMFQNQKYTTVFIGDSNNDANAMRKSDVSIAYGASHEPSSYCLAAADHYVRTQDELLQLLNKIAKEQ